MSYVVMQTTASLEGDSKLEKKLAISLRKWPPATVNLLRLITFNS